MKTTRNAIAVGILTVGILVGLYMAINFVSDSLGASGQYRVYALFPDASGLHEKSHVRIAGLKVGQIEKISLESYTKKVVDENGKTVETPAIGARVTFLINTDVILHENAKALKAADSLLGDQLVVLQPGDATVPALKDGGQIENVGEAGLMGNIDKITADIQSVTNNMKKVFGSDEAGQQMTEMLANLRDVSQSISELVKTNQQSVKSTLDNIEGIASDARPGIRQIVRDLKGITQEIKVFVANNTQTAGNAVNEAEGTIKDVRGAIQDVKKTVTTLDKTVSNLNDVVDGVKKGEGTVGRLLKDDKLINDVENTVEEVGDFVSGITRLKTILGLSTEFNALTRSFRSGVSLRLQPREDKYYMIELAKDPRGATTRTEIVTESTNPDDPAQYREVKTVTKDSFVFSLMLARRIYFATFRFGIKDNTGGVGMDLHFWDDRFELSTDIYKFNGNVLPLLKETLAFEFLKSLYLIGGVTDALNPQRDFFVGLMLRFDDEDLKTVLPFIPTGG